MIPQTLNFLNNLNPNTQHTPNPKPHISAVGCVRFSAEGNFLYSGGREGVLVLWRLDTGGERSYLPRLGGPLKHLAAAPDDFTRIVAACRCACFIVYLGFRC